MGDAEIEFRAMSAKIARLTVTRASGSFGLMTDAKTQVHQLGYRAGPLYRLGQPYSPDDAWTLDVIPSGKTFQESDGGGAHPWTTWLAGSAVLRGSRLLQELPRGEYLLVRSARPLQHLDRVLLGNELVPAPPNMCVLRQDKPVYSCVVGPRKAEPPRIDHPLVGLSVLNYTGSTQMQGVLFFSFLEPGSAPEGKDMVLVIPVSGGLVFDNMGFFSSKNEEESRRRWRDELSLQFGDWCADEAP